MAHAINSVLLITKAEDSRAHKLGNEMVTWLKERGVAVRQVENPESRAALELAFDDAVQDIGPEPDLVLVLGGDGTMLSVARRLQCMAPLLGVNLGKVGFLTELCPTNWKNALAEVIKNGVQISERLALEFEVLRENHDKPLFQGRVINDLVVSRGALARLVPIDVTVDGEHMALVRSDGFIVSTPTGATGYGVSANGPMLHPALQAYSLTAICPFMREFNPLVLPQEAVLELKILATTADIYLTMDGQEGYRLECGDIVRIRRAEKGFCIVRLGGASYFATLRAKGFVRETMPGEAAAHGCAGGGEEAAS